MVNIASDATRRHLQDSTMLTPPPQQANHHQRNYIYHALIRAVMRGTKVSFDSSYYEGLWWFSLRLVSLSSSEIYYCNAADSRFGFALNCDFCRLCTFTECVMYKGDQCNVELGFQYNKKSWILVVVHPEHLSHLSHCKILSVLPTNYK